MKTKKLLLFCGFIGAMAYFTSNLNAQSTSTTNIYELSTEPTIDGVADAAWVDFPVLPIVYQDGTPAVVRSSDANLGASYQVGWKGSKLFFLVKVTDDIPFYDVAAAEKYLQDYVSIYFNLNTTHLTDAGSYNSSLPQWYFLTNLNPAPELMNMAGHGGPSNAGTGWAWPSNQSLFPAGKELAWTATSGGYNVEVMLDFSDAGWLYTGTLADGVTLGFDVEVNDIDVLGGGRTQIFWSNGGVGTTAYNDVVGFGNGTIKSGAPTGTTSLNQIGANSPLAWVKNGTLHFNNLDKVNSVHVCTLTGQIVETINFGKEAKNYNKIFKSGIYLVTFKGEKTTTQKVVVQ